MRDHDLRDLRDLRPVAVDCDDAAAPMTSTSQLIVVAWDDTWPDAIRALRTGGHVDLGPWRVTAPLDGGILVDGPGRHPGAPRAVFAAKVKATSQAIAYLHAAARALLEDGVVFPVVTFERRGNGS